MSTETNDPLAVADAMMKERRDTVKSLAKLAGEKATLMSKVADIEKQEADAYELALASGWSQSELKKMGFTRKTSARKSKTSSEDKATVSPINGQEMSA